jgi:hypothetical protein
MASGAKNSKSFDEWRSEFSAAAVADKHRELLRSINHLDFKCSAKNAMEATVWLVCAVVTFCEMDGRDYETFLKQQTYFPNAGCGNKYCLIFDLSSSHKKYYGRIFTDAAFTSIDLEDLFNFAWPMSQTAGFSEVYITRIDGKKITKQELQRLYKLVEEDMYYGYSEEELSVDVIPTDFADTVMIYAAETDDI